MALAVADAEDLTAALEMVLHGVCQVTDWTLGQAWLPTAEGTLVCSPAWSGRGVDLAVFRRASERVTFTPGQGLVGQAWATGRPVWSRDATVDPRSTCTEAARAAGVRAGMAIPVLAGPDVVAVIEFFVSKERAEDAHLVAALAAQLRLRELATLKADFTAMITHELSAPAAAILRLTDMLATGALTPEEQAQTLATIRAEASTLRHLVADVRSTATVERDDFAVAIRPVPLGPILDAAAAVARGLPGEHSVTVESIEARVWAESSRSRWRWHRDPRPARRRSHRMFLMLSPVAPR